MLTLATALDLLHFSSGFNPMLTAEQVRIPQTGAVTFLRQHARGARVVGQGYNLTNDYDLVYGLEDIRGYDPPQPSQRYLDLWRTANPLQVTYASFSIVAVTTPTVHLISTLAARYVLAGPHVTLPSGLPLRLVYNGADATVFEDTVAAPRVVVARRVIAARNEAATLTAMKRHDFDPRFDAVVETSHPVRPAPSGTRAAGSATVVSRSNEHVTVDARLNRRSLVTLNDAYASGWNVTVDGRPATALRVNDVMRGVLVRAGSHRIVWQYAIPGFRVGLLITVFAALGLAGEALVLRRRRTPAAA